VGAHKINVNVVARRLSGPHWWRPCFPTRTSITAWWRGFPLGRIAEPDDVRNAVLFLVSPASDFITGQTIYLDGGITAHHSEFALRNSEVFTVGRKVWPCGPEPLTIQALPAKSDIGSVLRVYNRIRFEIPLGPIMHYAPKYHELSVTVAVRAVVNPHNKE